jgi:hypothetical protein
MAGSPFDRLRSGRTRIDKQLMGSTASTTITQKPTVASEKIAARRRDSVRRASDFVQIRITLTDHVGQFSKSAIWFHQQSQPAYNAAMRSRFAQIVALATTGFLVGKVSMHAQSTDFPAISVTRPALSDLDDRQPDRQPPSRPEISIAAVKISGAIQIPISDQDAIVNSIKLQIHGDSVDLVTEEASERVRAGWQDRGYFKVQVSGKAKLSPGSHGRRIAIEVPVDEGMQYRLSEITFKNNKAISDTVGLRGLFPIKDCDIVSREKIAAGLENLRNPMEN